MDDRHLDQLAVDLATGSSRRRVVKALVEAASAGVVSIFGLSRRTRSASVAQVAPQAPARTRPALPADQPETTSPPKPGAYCRNTEGTPSQPANPPTPFFYQPFAFPPDSRVDFGKIWSAQMDHTTPTYRQDGELSTLGERLAYSAHRDEQDPEGPLQGGTKVYLKDGYQQFDSTVAPEEITRETGATIFAYESPANEEYLFYDGHDGHDFAVTGDALAAAAGTVTFAGDSGTPFGRVVEIVHPEGYLTRYAHLASIAVEVGQAIDTPGEPVGRIGGSATIRGVLQDGFWRTHLHFSTFRWNAEGQRWEITDPFGWDPWQSPGEQSDDPLVACNGEISYNLWFGWWPRPYGEAADAAVLSARPTDGQYLGGSLSDEALEQAATPEAALAPADLSVYEVVGRAQAAIQQAGTYRYQVLDLQAGRAPVANGEVNLQQGMTRLLADGSSADYVVGRTLYSRDANGRWSTGQPLGFILRIQEELITFVREPAGSWTLVGQETVDGRPAYVIQQSGPGVQGTSFEQRLWVDAASFLPLEREAKVWPPSATATPTAPSQITETVYSDFGAPVDVQPPPEALAPTPTPTPEPTPPPVDPTLLDPYALLQLLLTSPFSLSELPPGYTFVEVKEAPLDDWATGAVGEVVVRTEDDPWTPGDEIRYAVFATADDAARALETFQAVLERQGFLSSYPVRGFDYPAVELTTSAAIPGIGTRAIAGVAVQVGNVLVVGSSATLPENPFQSRANAADLAAAGIERLRGLMQLKFGL